MSNHNTKRLEKFKSITTEVFALTLGLGAFSLSIIPKNSLLEVTQAVGFFGIAFFYIAIIWIINSRFFEQYPLCDNIFLGLNFVILFLVAISPFLMQVFSMSTGLTNPMSILYALDITGIFGILGVLHQRFLQQNIDSLKENEAKEIKMDRNMQFIISAWFLISAIMPLPCRFVFWMLLAPIPPIYRHVVGPLHVK
jgi:uncharacterized membrane protein